MKIFLGLALLLFTALPVIAQTAKADSLIHLLNKETTDTGRIQKLIEIGGLLDFTMSKSDSTLRYLQEAVDLSKKIGNTKLEIQATYYLANNLFNSGNYPRALVLSLTNLKKLEQLKSETNETILMINGRDLLFYQTRLLVFIYSNIGNYNSQLDYIKRMKSIYNASLTQVPGAINYKMTIYYNLTHVYTNLKMWDSAYHYRLILYNEVSRTNDPQWMALTTNALGVYHKKQNNLDTALHFFRICIPSAVKSGRSDIVVSCELNIGSIYQEKGMTDSAFYFTRQALQRVSQLNNPSDLQSAYKQLSELYGNTKVYDSAYKYMQNFIALEDSLHDLTKLTEAQNFAFNQTLLDQQVEQAKKETQQKAEARIKIYALAAVIAFILLAGFFLIRNLRNKRAANIVLTKQKEEIQQSLSALKDAQSQLIQSEKMASLGELTAGIAHEIQNPLNFVNNFSEVNTELLDELIEEVSKSNMPELKPLVTDIKENELKINHHGKRADAIVKGMLQHSRTSTSIKEPTDLNKLADEYLRLAYHGLKAKDKSFNSILRTDFDDSIGVINVIPQDIGRVILNLITNAFYAVNEKNLSAVSSTSDKYEPTVTVITKNLGNKIEINVTDNGNGIPQNIIDKIFQPFFTTKPTGQGTGLGLSLSYDTIKAHGGELNVQTKEGEGSQFCITLPKSN
jgi:signal transduction histidine kinase